MEMSGQRYPKVPEENMKGGKAHLIQLLGIKDEPYNTIKRVYYIKCYPDVATWLGVIDLHLLFDIIEYAPCKPYLTLANCFLEHQSTLTPTNVLHAGTLINGSC